MLDSIAKWVVLAGEPPEDLGPEKALRDLLASEALYSQLPQDLASYDKDLLGIAKGFIRPRRLGCEQRGKRV